MNKEFNQAEDQEDSELAKKHIPIIELEDSENTAGVIIEIKIGEIQHPSEDEHYINWIEIYDGKILLARAELSPASKARATFYLNEKPIKLRVRGFCNIHGTWEYGE